MNAALLDDDADLLDILAELLQEHGCRCVSARSLADLKALASEVLTADVAVLDINLGSGEPSGIDAYEWLTSQGFAGRILFLTGHAHAHPLVARAEQLRHAAVLDKPLDGRVLIERILGGAGSGAEAT
ncbi:MAG TPA: response regulator [Polyangia bacterium]|nr:response regulator [Polyangia bacterium]